jgi:dipeptidyl aminopeptidase/acylaminoacyl peptidase
LLVEVYGGSAGADYLHSFDAGHAIFHQLLAAGGYAVLFPDTPLEPRDPLRQVPGLVLPAVNRSIELGLADPDRLGLMGHSYGGYCTLALLVQTRRFKAAVAGAGTYDLVRAYTQMDEDGSDPGLAWVETGQGSMGGSPWTRRDAYIENSPLYALDRVETPLLLIQGSEEALAAGQAEAAFVGLRRLGKRVALRIYEGERHSTWTWSEAAFRDLCAHVLAWFDTYLKE